MPVLHHRSFGNLLLAWLSILSTGVVPVYGEACSDEKEDYANCIFRLDPFVGKTCDDCRISTFDDLQEPNECNALESKLCYAVNNCGCLNCNDELEAFWQCTTAMTTNATCSIQCNTEKSETPDGPLCPQQFEEYRQCVTNDLDEGTRTSCDECRLQASSSIPEDVTNCTDVQEIFCNAVETCNCGTCAGSLESYLDCDVYKRWFGECEISCGLENDTSPGNDVANQEGSGAGTSNCIFLPIVLGIFLSGLGQWPCI